MLAQTLNQGFVVAVADATNELIARTLADRAAGTATPLDDDVSDEALKQLELVNTLALSLIALAGGLELRVGDVRLVARSVLVNTLVQTSLVFLLSTALFWALALAHLARFQGP